MIHLEIYAGQSAELRADDGSRLAVIEHEQASDKWLAFEPGKADMLALDLAEAKHWLLWQAAKLEAVHGPLEPAHIVLLRPAIKIERRY